MTYTSKRIADLKAGDIVEAQGGVFRVLKDARPSNSHHPCHWVNNQGYVADHGPVDCAVADSECIHGYIGGYFWPGSSWTFQGATSVTIRVSIPA